MQNTAHVEKTGLTALTAINAAKILTIGCLVALCVVFGIQDMRQVIYLCLHIGYCTWWLLEQWLFPQRRQIFSELLPPCYNSYLPSTHLSKRTGYVGKVPRLS